MASNFATRLLPTTPFCHCDCHCHFQKFEYFSLRGEFVYIRDDREQQEYFGLCEVQVGTSFLIIAIIIITRPKPAYGRQGLAGLLLRASGAQLGMGK